MTFLRTLLTNLHNRKAQKRACKRLEEPRSRASTKLSPGYEKRRIRELRHARTLFEGPSQ